MSEWLCGKGTGEGRAKEMGFRQFYFMCGILHQRWVFCLLLVNAMTPPEWAAAAAAAAMLCLSCNILLSSWVGVASKPLPCLPSISHRPLLSCLSYVFLPGSDCYQERLVEALARHLNVRLLVFDLQAAMVQVGTDSLTG